MLLRAVCLVRAMVRSVDPRAAEGKEKRLVLLAVGVARPERTSPTARHPIAPPKGIAGAARTGKRQRLVAASAAVGGDQSKKEVEVEPRGQGRARRGGGADAPTGTGRGAPPHAPARVRAGARGSGRL